MSGARTFAIDATRLDGWLRELARFSDAPAPAVERVLYTPTDLAGRAFVRGLAESLGLAVRVDAVGNTFFRLEGREPALAAVATGSHLDAIPNAGRFDGTVGVLGGLAALEAIRGAGITPRRAIEVIAFTSEEPTRFGLGCVGSRLMSGAIAPEAVRALRDAAGRPFEEVRADAGFVGALEEVRLPEGHYHAFVELHVEQGPVLEREGVAIGVVTAIAAPASYVLEIEGEGGHAGAVLMPDRKDALCAAAEIILAVEDAARTSGSDDTVATVGVCRVFPGAINGIAARVHLELDLRDTSLAAREEAFAVMAAAIERIAAARRVRVSRRTINEDPPAQADAAIVAAVEASAAAHGLTSRRMPSRAYHDALFMARIAPMGMVFVPSARGVSHRPDEYTAPEDVARGAAVLAGTLLKLAEDGDG
ncbi:MAG: M20 family metallo-hydrolase [Myxococcales bacterium]|nr:M20 family metallo-hydrolase [Myxococcales bacterium]